MIEAIFAAVIGLVLFSIPFLILEAVVRGIWNGLVALKRRARDARARRKAALAHARAVAESRRRERENQRQARVRHVERQREQLMAARQAELQRRQSATEQRRRNDARAKCECRWSLYEQHIAQRFSRSDFERFVRTFMTDTHTADEVEARAAQLLQILESHYARRTDAEQPRQFKTLEDTTEWFLEQRERITRLPVDEQTREEHLARLQAVYADLSARVLETPT